MGLKLANNALSRLSAGISPTDTSIVLVPGGGALFPSLGAGDYFPATIVKSDGSIEIVKVTARATDVLTIVRAQESTTAKAFNAGDRIELRLTAGTYTDEFANKVSNQDLEGNAGASFVGHKRPEPGALLFTISKYHNCREFNAAVDFGIDFSGSTDQTAAFNALVDALTDIAITNGRCPSVALPYGKLRIDGEVRLLPFMRFHSLGALDILCLGYNGASFWIKNDVAIPQPMGEADYNLGPVFDGSKGVIRVVGNQTAGSKAFKFGNSEGSSFTGLYAAFSGLRAMHITNFEDLIYFNNNNVFANRFELLKLSNASNFAISNAATAPVNSGELLDFRGCFINNCEGGIQTNAEIEIAYSGSISFTKKPVRLNGNNIAVLHFNGTHFEKFGQDGDDALILSTATSTTTQPVVNLSGNVVSSSFRSDIGTANVLRTMFKGKMNLNFAGFNVHSDTVKTAGTEYQFLCDPDVNARGIDTVRAGGAVYIATSSDSRVPDPFCASTTRYTPGSVNTTLTAVTAGTPARTALSLTSPGAQRNFQTDYFPVTPGEFIFGSALVDVAATTAGAKVYMRISWYFHDKTLEGQTVYLLSDLTSQMGTSGWKHAYLGTGRRKVPAGVAYGRIDFATDAAFAGTMLVTSFIAGNS